MICLALLSHPHSGRLTSWSPLCSDLSTQTQGYRKYSSSLFPLKQINFDSKTIPLEGGKFNPSHSSGSGTHLPRVKVPWRLSESRHRRRRVGLVLFQKEQARLSQPAGPRRHLPRLGTSLSVETRRPVPEHQPSSVPLWSLATFPGASRGLNEVSAAQGMHKPSGRATSL